jgi:hypothetical protein
MVLDDLFTDFAKKISRTKHQDPNNKTQIPRSKNQIINAKIQIPKPPEKPLEFVCFL